MLAFLAMMALLAAQQEKIIWTPEQLPVAEQIQGLREVPDAKRGGVTKALALRIRRLPASDNKLTLAHSLANLSTEGDFGHDTLQQVATTLAESLREQAAVAKGGMPEEPWVELAQLVRYEHVAVSLDSPLLTTAMARLQAEDQRRAQADFTLTDLRGKVWILHDLRSQVVLVNFWATWCPPCRKEMPDLNALYQQFSPRGLVILAISDEEMAKVKPFVEEGKIAYPILLDPGSKVHKALAVEGIPRTFLYDRLGKLVAQAIDMRTRGQFLEMLSQAGLR
jgi:peroxiredoxin